MALVLVDLVGVLDDVLLAVDRVVVPVHDEVDQLELRDVQAVRDLLDQVVLQLVNRVCEAGVAEHLRKVVDLLPELLVGLFFIFLTLPSHAAAGSRRSIFAPAGTPSGCAPSSAAAKNTPGCGSSTLSRKTAPKSLSECSC